jgi:hypothetical protein
MLVTRITCCVHQQTILKEDNSEGAACIIVIFPEGNAQWLATCLPSTNAQVGGLHTIQQYFLYLFILSLG